MSPLNAKNPTSLHTQLVFHNLSGKANDGLQLNGNENDFNELQNCNATTNVVHKIPPFVWLFAYA